MIVPVCDVRGIGVAVKLPVISCTTACLKGISDGVYVPASVFKKNFSKLPPVVPGSRTILSPLSPPEPSVASINILPDS